MGRSWGVLAPVTAGRIDCSHALFHSRVPRGEGAGAQEKQGQDSHLPGQLQNVGGGL